LNKPEDKIKNKTVSQIVSYKIINNVENIQIKANQKHLVCDSYINNNKLIKLNSATNDINNVLKLEKFLNDYYHSAIAENGIYEIEDMELIKRFQSENQLQVDGVVGLGTIRIINAVQCLKSEEIIK
jgi:murein L,D-transpeptidase YcbB/YkuD